MDGGIITPIAPAVAIRAAANAGGYPTSTIAGIRIRPRAATVAGPEPEIAAKKHATSTHTIATPPLKWPTHAWASLIRRVEIPDFSIMLPPRMKKGIAIRTDLVIAAETSCGTVPSTTASGRPAPITTIAATLDIPRQTAIGAPNSKSTAKSPKSTVVTISQTSSSF